MTGFLIKSTLCLIVVLALYYVVLEKEKMHVFNRFYLLGGLLFSFAIPFVTIKVNSGIELPIQQNIMPSVSIFPEIENQIDYLQLSIWVLYGIVTSFFLARFILNLLKISGRIRRNPKLISGSATLVLLPETVLPHTFGNYIFINASDYRNRNIEDELYLHEFTHAKQKHTLDILFIEILKTIFWFNPLLYLYKKAIQLNHEFLADEKVATKCSDISFYQNLLLEKATIKNTVYLASNLNYLVTKKRLLMMTKTTSKSTIAFKKIAMVPIFTCLFFLLCLKTTAQEPEPKTNLVNETGIEKAPEFDGGLTKFYEYIGKNFKVPKEIYANKIKGKIFLSFVIEKDGSITEVKVLRDLGYGTAEEAKRVLENSPKWKPGIQKGTPVRVSYSLPLSLDGTK